MEIEQANTLLLFTPIERSKYHPTPIPMPNPINSHTPLYQTIGFLLVGLYGFSFQVMGQSPIQFKAQTLDSTISIGYGLAIGDVDGDGKPDILLADKKEFVWYRNGDWKRFTMIRNLTERDNVCIAAQDINGDRKVEVAVGAQWNPGETTDPSLSGSVHYLQRPEDPTQLWQALPLPHVPTIHRMKWVPTMDGDYQLIVLPLHGIGNRKGEGVGVQVLAYPVLEMGKLAGQPVVIDSTMHLTHNFDSESLAQRDQLYIGGKEGVQLITSKATSWAKGDRILQGHSFGEVRVGKGLSGNRFIAGIEPMHGNLLSVNWQLGRGFVRQVLCEDLNQGHALACADLLGEGQDQIIVGWRNPNEEGKVGIRMYRLVVDGSWEQHSIDDNEMACEDLKISDLNGDGRLDIIACGRATQNLKIYWNLAD